MTFSNCCFLLTNLVPCLCSQLPAVSCCCSALPNTVLLLQSAPYYCDECNNFLLPQESTDLYCNQYADCNIRSLITCIMQQQDSSRVRTAAIGHHTGQVVQGLWRGWGQYKQCRGCGGGGQGRWWRGCCFLPTSTQLTATTGRQISQRNATLAESDQTGFTSRLQTVQILWQLNS